MSILSTMAASSALASGTNNARLPRRRASNATGKTPFTARTAPSKASSPTKLKFSKGDLSKRDRQIEAWSLFLDVGRCEIDCGSAAGPKVSAICNRSRHAVAALFHGGIRQADDNNVWVAASSVDFYFNFVR